MDCQSLPMVPFGKYKNQPVTVLLNDTGTLEYYIRTGILEKQLKERCSILYNFIINQTIGSVNGVDSKTPEHNKLQSLFLERDFNLKFINSMYNYKNALKEIEQLYKTDEYIQHFGEDRFCCEDFGLGNCSIRAEFETMFNWDVVLSFDNEGKNRIAAKNNLNPEKFLEKICGHKYLLPSYHFGTFYFASQKTVLFIEVKPFLGDDYPNVLRKMRDQISFTKNYYIKNIGKNYDGSIYFKCATTFAFILFVKEFSSTVITKEQLIATFKPANIKIVFLKDVIGEKTSLNPDIHNVPQMLEIKESNCAQVLQEKIIKAEDKSNPKKQNDSKSSQKEITTFFVKSDKIKTKKQTDVKSNQKSIATFFEKN